MGYEDVKFNWSLSINATARPVEATWQEHIDRVESLVKAYGDAKLAGVEFSAPEWLTEGKIYKGLKIRDYRHLGEWARKEQLKDRRRPRPSPPCCEKAVRHACVCITSWKCPEHGIKCYGSHD